MSTVSKLNEIWRVTVGRNEGSSTPLEVSEEAIISRHHHKAKVCPYHNVLETL